MYSPSTPQPRTIRTVLCEYTKAIRASSYLVALFIENDLYMASLKAGPPYKFTHWTFKCLFIFYFN